MKTTRAPQKQVMLLLAALLAVLPITIVVARPASISTHVLDVAEGRPAAEINVTSYFFAVQNGVWEKLATKATNEQGRVDDVLSGSSHEMLQERSGGASPLRAGTYKLCWETGAYFQRRGHKTFFPYVEVVFTVDDPGQHYHVPLLLSNFSYSTYRGQ